MIGRKSTVEVITNNTRGIFKAANGVDTGSCLLWWYSFQPISAPQFDLSESREFDLDK